MTKVSPSANAHIPSAFHALLLIPLSIAALYWQVYNFEFLNFDDNIYISENAHVLGGLSVRGFQWAFTSTLGGHWHPLTWLSLMFDVTLFGPSAAAMHFENVGLHILNAILLYLLIATVVLDKRVALGATLLWALHPLRIESVAWVSQRKDVLSLFFGLLTSLSFLRFRVSGSQLTYLTSLGLFTLALLTKPTMVTLPVLVIITEVAWRLSRGQVTSESLSKSFGKDKVLFFILAAFAAGVSLFSQHHGGGLREISDITIGRRIGLALTGYVTYLGKLFWPLELSIFYPLVDNPSGLAAGCFASLVAISAGAFLLLRKYPELSIAWMWFLVALLPVVGFITVGAQAVSDRWSQLAHIGPIVAIVYLLSRNRKQATLFVSSLVLLLAILTFTELPNWRNSKTIFARALVVNSNNFLAHTNLGVALTSSNEFAARVMHFEEAVRLNPTYPEALNNLGMVRAQTGRYIEARELFVRALAINPNLSAAKNNLAQVELDMGR